MGGSFIHPEVAAALTSLQGFKQDIVRLSADDRFHIAADTDNYGDDVIDAALHPGASSILSISNQADIFMVNIFAWRTKSSSEFVKPGKQVLMLDLNAARINNLFTTELTEGNDLGQLLKGYIAQNLFKLGEYLAVQPDLDNIVVASLTHGKIADMVTGIFSSTFSNPRGKLEDIHLIDNDNFHASTIKFAQERLASSMQAAGIFGPNTTIDPNKISPRLIIATGRALAEATADLKL
jgi:hypothetical protein